MEAAGPVPEHDLAALLGQPDNPPRVPLYSGRVKAPSAVPEAGEKAREHLRLALYAALVELRVHELLVGQALQPVTG